MININMNTLLCILILSGGPFLYLLSFMLMYAPELGKKAFNRLCAVILALALILFPSFFTVSQYFLERPSTGTIKKEVYSVTGKTQNLETGKVSYDLVTKEGKKRRVTLSFAEKLKKNDRITSTKKYTVTKNWLFTVKHPVEEKWEK